MTTELTGPEQSSASDSKGRVESMGSKAGKQKGQRVKPSRADLDLPPGGQQRAEVEIALLQELF